LIGRPDLGGLQLALRQMRPPAARAGGVRFT
jgi:hypothetical protein